MNIDHADHTRRLTQEALNKAAASRESFEKAVALTFANALPRHIHNAAIHGLSKVTVHVSDDDIRLYPWGDKTVAGEVVKARVIRKFMEYHAKAFTDNGYELHVPHGQKGLDVSW